MQLLEPVLGKQMQEWGIWASEHGSRNLGKNWGSDCIRQEGEKV